jgi:methyl-accepting chemotaxis protein
MNWSSNTIQETAPFPNSHCSLLGRDGELLVHPDSTKERHRAAYTEAQNNDYKGARKTARAMMAGESGYNAITLDGQDYYVFYKPFENIGWSVAIVCPEEDIFGRYHRMQTYMAIITVAGLLLLLLFIMLTTHYYMKPLHLLTRLARRISEGHYTMSIPINNRQDEISFLQNNFRTMQESLASQINEIEQLSKTLNERNEALKRAYEQGLEADRVKTAFLRNMSDRMAVLINGIGAVVKKLTENYENMPADEMACLVNKMESQSNEAAQLLNQLIDVSLKDKGSIVSDNPNNTEQP